MKSRVVVDASDVKGKINPMVYGHFIENLARCIYGGLLENEKPGHPHGPWNTREDLVEMIREIKPPVLRWPGGLYADGYFWRDGIGPVQARPLKRNRYWSRYGPATRVLDPNWFGTHEYLDLMSELKATPYINVNFGSGSAVEAARWVEYVNGSVETLEGARRASYGHQEPWKVKYWGIGNEMYGFWTIGHSGPREYARRYMEFKQAMEEVDPKLSYVAVGADDYMSKTWNREVLSEIGEDMDLLSIHTYLPGMERAFGVAAARARRGSGGIYRSIVAAPLEFERRLRVAADDIESVMGSGSKVKVAFDEWNLWWEPSQLLFTRWTLRDALFVCGMFHVFHRTSDFLEMANVAQLVNVLGILAARGDRVQRTAMYYPFLMYTNLAGPLRVGTRVTCDSFSSPKVGGIPEMSEVPVIDCSATLSSKRKTLTLFVVNRHMTDQVEVELEINGYDPKSKVEIHCLNGPSHNAKNSFGDDEVVSIDRRTEDAGDVLPRYKFPAHSATALVFKAS